MISKDLGGPNQEQAETVWSFAATYVAASRLTAICGTLFTTKDQG